MNKKYEILNGNDAECIKFYDKTLYRIRALKDFANVKAGDIGGYIESESNLSQEGNAWIYDNAKIYGDAKICSNARIYGDASIYDNVLISGNARIYGNAEIYGNAVIYDNVWISGNARIFGDSVIHDNARIHDNVRIYGDARIYGNAVICGNAEIMSHSCILTITNIGSRNDTTTFFTGADGKIYVACGCFRGSIDEFKREVQKTHGDNIHGQMYQMAIEMAKKKLGVKV